MEFFVLLKLFCVKERRLQDGDLRKYLDKILRIIVLNLMLMFLKQLEWL